MKFKEIIEKSEAALTKDLSELRDEIEQLTVKARLGQLKNTSTINLKRKTVAKILTALRQK
jgi:ribosomal protein L29